MLIFLFITRKINIYILNDELGRVPQGAEEANHTGRSVTKLSGKRTTL